MSTAVLVYVLTALAAVVVVLTRLRLQAVVGDTGNGSLRIARGPVTVHTVAGGLALVSWTTFLAGGDRFSENTATVVGLVGLTCWWVTVAAGLLILLRWLPVRGRHAGPGAADTWSQGPALSVLAHVGLLVGVVVFTYAYLVSAV